MRKRNSRHRPLARRARPYVLIISHDPRLTLGEGVKARYPTMLAAANAFAKSTAPCKTVIYDDGHEPRELDAREQALLERVCALLGLDVEEVDR